MYPETLVFLRARIASLEGERERTVVSDADVIRMVKQLADIEGELEKVKAERDLARGVTLSVEAAVVATIGGMVEGAPTSRLNYLQRLRELVAIKERRDDHEAEMEHHADRVVAERDAARAALQAAKENARVHAMEKMRANTALAAAESRAQGAEARVKELEARRAWPKSVGVYGDE